MDKGNLTVGERLSVVETELKYVKVGLSDLTEEVRESSKSTRVKFDSITTAMNGINSVIENKLRGSLSGREKSAIIIALITSITSIILVFLK